MVDAEAAQEHDSTCFFSRIMSCNGVSFTVPLLIVIYKRLGVVGVEKEEEKEMWRIVGACECHGPHACIILPSPMVKCGCRQPHLALLFPTSPC